MAKVAYLRTIEDELLDPYYITMDDYCYTLHEDLSKKKDKTYTKKLGHFKSLDIALERAATHKTNKDSYSSIKEYILNYRSIKNQFTNFEVKI